MTDWSAGLPDVRVSRPGLLVALGGFCSMGLEVTAGRLLTPVFGSGVYTWGSTIGVFLTALSLGYYLGGRYSDRASVRGLGQVMAGASGLAFLLLVVSDPVIAWAGRLPLDPSVSVLVPLVVLFGPPTALIGFISPFAAELQDASTGQASGTVYALGTVGSILGAFAATFVLIPTFTTQTILALFGFTLAIGTIIAAPRAHLLMGAMLVLVGAATLMTVAPELRPGTVYHTQTAYQELAVVEQDGVRTLWLNGVRNSAEYINGSDAYPFSYPPYLHIPQAMMQQAGEEVDSALFIGGGAFSVPRRYEEAGVNVTVVEIDPAVVQAAERHFGIDRSDYNVHVMDGRRFLRRTNQTFDVIVLDAYQGTEVPFHLTTVEFMRLVREHLNTPGVVASNLITAVRGPQAEFYRSEAATMQQVFPRLYRSYWASPYLTQNVELIATQGLPRFNASELRDSPVVDRYALGDELDHLELLGPVDGTVLRDSKAPVDSMLAG